MNWEIQLRPDDPLWYEFKAMGLEIRDLHRNIMSRHNGLRAFVLWLSSQIVMKKQYIERERSIRLLMV